MKGKKVNFDKIIAMCDNILRQEHAGVYQADVALIMVPCDGNFTTALAKGKAGEISKVKPASIPG